ncbi:hypothetical protein AVEN_163927-1 [Araneus ventricosus]|uniref:Uncharacterized protein n=1 Tax=Araneus ventricosus TaxID=182803 RepID=A0A4Y2MIJ7_ARAVE|nr:hypothetical protein AVEN_163927-1 [Araneus ventricosus]
MSCDGFLNHIWSNISSGFPFGGHDRSTAEHCGCQPVSTRRHSNAYAVTLPAPVMPQTARVQREIGKLSSRRDQLYLAPAKSIFQSPATNYK